MAIIPSTSKSRGSEELHDLGNLFKDKVRAWLNSPIKELILDYLTIKNSHKVFAVSDLSDYSYLITPAFKALEGTLIQIAEEIGFDLEQYQFKIGVVFSDESLEKFYEDILDKIEELDEEYKSDIQMWLNDARRILRHFRHSPAHFMGEAKKSWEEAFSVGDHILRIINEMCYSLIKSEIFQKAKKQ